MRIATIILLLVIITASVFSFLDLNKKSHNLLFSKISKNLNASIVDYSYAASDDNKLDLNYEDLSNLVKPSIVRVVQTVSGQATIPPFDIDFNKLEIFKIDNPDQEPLMLPIDDYLSGSGFIINPDGYILTNSHVISQETVKQEVVRQVALEAVNQKIIFEDEQDLQNISEDVGFEFGKKIAKFIYDESAFDIKSTIVVLNPSSTKNKFKDLIDEGFAAKIVDVNDDFINDNRDVGLIRINLNNLPAIKISDASSLSVGSQVYIFGFPATADFNGNNFLESSFTGGIISAVRDSKNKDFKIFQTDAKVSQGSSGGPLFDGKGAVQGLVTYQTDEIDQSKGDNFNFAIPIEVAQDVLRKEAVQNLEGNFNWHFKKGLSFMAERRCKSAISEFNLSGDTNYLFKAADNTKLYMDRCNAMITAGLSIDSWWDTTRNWLKNIDVVIWPIIVVLIILIGAIIFLTIRLRKDEKELHQLEENANSLKGFGRDISSDQITQYIDKARSAGMKDYMIVEELKRAGWSEDDIQKSL